MTTEREALALDTVRKYSYWAMGAGLIPVPFVDLAAMFGIQVKMVSDLAKHYNLEFSHDRGKALISSLVGSAVPAAGGSALASVVKMIPVVGMTVGAIAVPAVAGASTFAVGKVFIQHFESGGTFLDFDPDAVRSHYAEEFEKGKAPAKK